MWSGSSVPLIFRLFSEIVIRPRNSSRLFQRCGGTLIGVDGQCFCMTAMSSQSLPWEPCEDWLDGWEPMDWARRPPVNEPRAAANITLQRVNFLMWCVIGHIFTTSYFFIALSFKLSGLFSI